LIRIVDIVEATKGEISYGSIHGRMGPGGLGRLEDDEGYLCLSRKDAREILDMYGDKFSMIPLRKLAERLGFSPYGLNPMMEEGERGDEPWDGRIYGKRLAGRWWYVSRGEFDLLASTITTAQAAERFGVSQIRVQQFIRESGIQTFDFGSSKRVKAFDLEQYWGRLRGTVTTAQVAELYGCSKITVERKLKKFDISRFRHGRAYRFRLRDYALEVGPPNVDGEDKFDILISMVEGGGESADRYRMLKEAGLIDLEEMVGRSGWGVEN
jgi:hypothetical protein